MPSFLERVFPIIVLASVGQVFAASGDQAIEQQRALRIWQPVYPESLNRIGVTEGSASVAFGLDATGALVDFLPVAYTHEPFYTASVDALKKTTFDPARGSRRPVPVVQVVTFNFKAGRNVVEMGVDDDVEAQMGRMRGPGEGFSIGQLSALDQPPVPVSIVSPGYPDMGDGIRVEGDVTIEFYIDADGNVRLPAVVEQSSAAFGAVAMDAIRQWSFEPPMRNRKRVSVVARQRFHFEPPMGDATSGEPGAE